MQAAEGGAGDGAGSKDRPDKRLKRRSEKVHTIFQQRQWRTRFYQENKGLGSKDRWMWND